MISREKFEELEMEHGCGYWNVCWEHACPCAITTEDKGYSEEIYNDLVEEAREVVKMAEEEGLFDDNEDFEDWYNDEEEFDDYLEEDDCDGGNSIEGGCGMCPYEKCTYGEYFKEMFNEK